MTDYLCRRKGPGGQCVQDTGHAGPCVFEPGPWMFQRPLRWYWWDLRNWCAWTWHERLPFAVAYLVPRKVALLVFIRVYAVWGECGPEFDVVTKLWESGRGR